MNYNKIINFFIDKEANTPPVVLLNNSNIKNDKKFNTIVNSKNVDLNWNIKPSMNHIVYLGIISSKKINANTNGNFYTYLLSFEIDKEGYPIPESLNIPQFLINIVHKKNNAPLEIGKNSQFYKFVEKEFFNWINILKEINNKTNFDDLKKLLEYINDLVENFKDEDFSAISYIESSIDGIFDSFKDNEKVIYDLVSIKNKGVKEGSALSSFLKENDQKIDISNDKRNIEKIIEPKKMNYSSWPNEDNESLVLSEQIAVNLIFNDIVFDQKIFSINNPSFVNNEYVIKEIFSTILLNKANAIMQTKRKDEKLFNKTNEINIDGKIIDVYKPNKNISGFEIIFTSKNKKDLKIKKDNFFNENYFGENFIDFILGIDTQEEKNIEKMINFKNLELNKSSKEVFNNLIKNLNSIKLLNKKIEENKLTKDEFEFFKSSCDLNLFNKDINELHKMSLFNQKEIKRIRSSIFLDVLKFNNEIITENKDIYIDTVNLIKYIKEGKINNKDIINDAWKTFFIFCPIVISSDVTNDFDFFNEEDIGWLVVNNSEEYSCNEIINNIWKSKNFIALGNLNRNKKINYNDYSYNNLFNNKYEINDWGANCSLLDLMNRKNKFGEYVKNKWISCSIKKSREKSNINKKALNELLYEKKIIVEEDENYNEEIFSIIGKSFWFNVKNEENKNNEYDLLKFQLKMFFEKQSEYSLPDLYITSPYLNVIDEIKSDLLNNKNDWITSDYQFSDIVIENWINERVLLINKLIENDVKSAFFVLGGNEKDKSWINNDEKIISLLFDNIKENTYIIGDKDIWSIGSLKKVREILK